jgi:hypothetical protein
LHVILDAGYPAVMTEFGAGAWGESGGGLDVALTAELERSSVSWQAFAYVPPWGVSDDVSQPEVFKTRVDRAGLSWSPDFGTWPVARGVHSDDGEPWMVPGYQDNRLVDALRIEAEDFDEGGKGVAYDNGNASNPGGQYRTGETVGIGATTDQGGEYDVAWTAAGDWLEYTLQVPAAGTYDLRLRVAGSTAGGVRVLAGGREVTGTFDLPGTGGEQSWATATQEVLLGEGRQKLRIEVVGGGFRLNWMELSPTANGPIPNGTYTFQNVESGQFLGVDASDTVVTGSTSESWSIEHIGGAEYKVALATDSEAAWTVFAGPLHLGPWWGAAGDRCFIILAAGNDTYRILPASSGLSLVPSSEGLGLDSEVSTEAAAQQWVIR